MAHFAELDDQNVVLRVIVISNDDAPDPYPESEPLGQAYIADVLGLAGEWKQTSYNSNFRGNYAGIGYTYDDTLDAFIPPEPPDAIGFDEDTLTWIMPEREPEPEPEAPADPDGA